MHMLAGPPAKKRNLNAIRNEDTMIINTESSNHLQQENEQLRAMLAEAEGRLALMANGSAALPGMINQFKI